MKSLVDLKKDLVDLTDEAATLREEIKLYQIDAKAADVIRELLSKSGLAANTTKLYTGCEHVMEYLAKTVDKAPIEHGDGGWHAQLLDRMAKPYLQRREKIISDRLFNALNRLRGFRHRERSSYGRKLDGSIVADRATEMADAADLFRAEVEAFIQNYAGSIES